MKTLLKTFALMAVVAAVPFLVIAKEDKGAVATSGYKETRFVANKDKYHADSVEPTLINAWGIAIRPAGAGGHFWVTAHNTSFEYVGDVQGSSDAKLRKMHMEPTLKYVKLPVGGEDNMATGVVFVDSKDHFVITQQPTTGAEITAPAKFLFASDGGIISAWTERKKDDGTFDRAAEAIPVIDMSKEGAQFFGLAISNAYDKIYVADFGAHPAVRVFDGAFKPLDIKFDMPFDDNKNGQVDPGEYAPFNVQTLLTPAGHSDVFVTYAKTQLCPAEEVAKKTCEEGALFVGEEDTSKPGQGRLAEFNEDGTLVAVWKDGGKLSAPWGIVYAPKDFGVASERLLVGNFGDGTIASYDATTREFVDVLRDEKGQPIKIEKVWGLLFGNGASLGDTNALYFAAGPDDENDGLFGSLRPAGKK